MFEFLRSSRDSIKRPSAEPAEQLVRPPSTPGPASHAAHTATQRELIRVVLRDTLRVNGIPTEWISGEVLSPSPSAPPGMQQIQLVIHHWHEGLLRYAPLLQQRLLQGLQRFDPVSDHSGHRVVWKFSPDIVDRHADFPPADFWRQETATDKPKFDLPPTARDFQGDDGFAPTEPGPLR